MTEPDSKYTAADCCGNGCANCVLDPKTHTQSEDTTSKKSNALEEFRKYKLLERNQLITYIYELRFRLNDREQLTGWTLDCPPGYHIMMRAPDPDVADSDERNYILRPYTPFWTEPSKFEFKILINIKPQGKMTRYIEQLNIGNEVEFRGPIGSYRYQPSNDPGQMLLIFTQGVAVTPAIPIIERILNNENDLTKVHHNMCYEDLESILFRSEISKYNQFWNYCGKIYLAREYCDGNPEDCEEFKKKLLYREMVYPRRLGKEDIQSEVEAFGEKQIEAIVSGSKAFQEFIVDSLNSCNNVDGKYIYML